MEAIDTQTSEYAKGFTLGDKVKYHGKRGGYIGYVIEVPDGSVRDAQGNILVGIRVAGDNTYGVMHVPAKGVQHVL